MTAMYYLTLMMQFHLMKMICNFKKVVLLLLVVLPSYIFGQYVQVPTHYDAEHTAHHIMRGHIKMYLSDTAKLVIEKRSERYITHCGVSATTVKSKLDKVFSKGKPEYTSRTNGGYIFTIAVVDFNDDTKIVNYVTCHVNAWTQKIEEVEILLGE